MNKTIALFSNVVLFKKISLVEDVGRAFESYNPMFQEPDLEPIHCIFLFVS